MKPFVTILALVVMMAGCGRNDDRKDRPGDNLPVDTSEVVKKGSIVIKSSFETLSSNLKRAIHEGGVPYALRFCNVQAQPLTDSLARHYGIKLRRASHKPRNTRNLATGEEMEVIRKYQRQIENNEKLNPVVRKTESAIYLHSPIRFTTPLCLNCHGSPKTDISGSNLKLISKLYPDDRATGFEMGDLRGIWAIKFPIASVDSLGEPQGQQHP